ncbi:hypothetical protein D3C79_614280 [compost metagenome]
MQVSQLRQLPGGNLGSETLDAVVAAMHPHQQAAARADGRFIVAGMGAVGGTDLMQFDPGAGHDVRNAKGAANLDQFATGDDAFLARPQTVQRQQYGCRIVVDHRDRLGAGQLTDQPFNQVIAITALAGGQVELEVQWVTGSHLHCINGFLGQQRPPQVGV